MTVALLGASSELVFYRGMMFEGEPLYAAVLMLAAGASGFLLKNTDPVELLRAVRVVADAEALLAPSVTRRLIGEFAARRRPGRPRAEVDLASLTDREREVMALAAAGLSNGEIADRLGVSPATARTHVSRAMVKLGDRAQLVVFAYESGLVVPGRG